MAATRFYGFVAFTQVAYHEARESQDEENEGTNPVELPRLREAGADAGFESHADGADNHVVHRQFTQAHHKQLAGHRDEGEYLVVHERQVGGHHCEQDDQPA